MKLVIAHLLFLFFCIPYYYPQFCHKKDLNNSTTAETMNTGCQTNTFCDQSLDLCKCQIAFYGTNCDKRSPIPSLIIEGITDKQFGLLVSMSILFFSFSCISGSVAIYCIFKPKNPVQRVKCGEEKTEIQKNESEKEKENERSVNPSSKVEVQLENLRAFVAEMECSLKFNLAKNENITNILDNISYYFSFSTIPNRSILSNIYSEIENIFSIVRNNQHEFPNFHLPEYERKLKEIREADKEKDIKLHVLPNPGTTKQVEIQETQCKPLIP